MTPPNCPSGLQYDGPERRKTIIDRRQSDECMYHEAHEVRFAQGEAKAKIICHNVEVLQESMGNNVKLLQDTIGTKVPNKLFYATASGFFAVVLIILGVQWGTYREVNNIAIDHAKQMGEINTNIAKVNSEITHANETNNTARTTIREALQMQLKIQEESQKRTDKKIDEILVTIENLHQTQKGGKK